MLTQSWKRPLSGALACLCLILGASLTMKGQNMSRTVVGNAGDYYENLLFGNLHWTVGEVAASRFQNGIELDEGFHQVYYDLVVKTTTPLPEDWQVNVYPNPTANFVRIELDDSLPVHAQLFSPTGQTIIDQPQLYAGEELDLSSFPAGVYWLRLQDEEGRMGHFQIQKIRR